MDAKAKNGKPTRRDDGPKEPAGGVAAGVSVKRPKKKPVKSKPVPSVASNIPPPPKPPKRAALTQSELRFCESYAIDGNGTKAYRYAFPECTYDTARTEASRLLAKPCIRAELAATQREHSRATRLTAIRALREACAIAFADLDDVFERGPDGAPQPRDWAKIPKAMKHVISNVKLKRRKQVGLDTEWVVEELDYKFHDKLSALDKLFKHLGLTSDGEALRQLLELVGNGKAAGPAQPAELVDRSVDPSHGPTGDKPAATDRPTDKPLPANG